MVAKVIARACALFRVLSLMLVAALAAEASYRPF
jgi:hypothetical protein